MTELAFDLSQDTVDSLGEWNKQGAFRQSTNFVRDVEAALTSDDGVLLLHNWRDTLPVETTEQNAVEFVSECVELAESDSFEEFGVEDAVQLTRPVRAAAAQHYLDDHRDALLHTTDAEERKVQARALSPLLREVPDSITKEWVVETLLQGLVDAMKSGRPRDITWCVARAHVGPKFENHPEIDIENSEYFDSVTPGPFDTSQSTDLMHVVANVKTSSFEGNPYVTNVKLQAESDVVNQAFTIDTV